MNKKILILSGPTHEYFDPVRFIGNASSGLMGKAIAEEAANKGYVVEFVTGPVSSENLPDLRAGSITHVTGAEEMLSTASELFDSADAAVFAAAVADYTPAEKRTEKLPKSSTELMLKLRPTPDIAKTLSSSKRPEQITIGFALQTEDGENYASKKLKRKKLDAIVLNSPTSLGSPTGTFSFLSKDAETFDPWGSIEKCECARNIISFISEHLNAG